MKRLGILLSGRGSNFEAIANHIASGKLDAEIALVISNRAEARGIETGAWSAASRLWRYLRKAWGAYRARNMTGA